MGLLDIFKRKKDETPAEEPENEGTAAAAPSQTDKEPAEEPVMPESGTAEAAPEAPAEEEPDQAPAEDTVDNVTPMPVPAPAKAVRQLTPEEIEVRRALAKKQQEEMETKGKLLSYMIDQYHEQRTPKALEAAVRCLGDTMVVVPMQMLFDKADAEAMALAKQQGRQFKPAKPVRLVPALFKNAKGSLHYPVYASRADIPKDQMKKFVWVNVPAPKCSVDVIRNEKVEALVVNPFGKSLVLNRDLLRQIVQVKPVETPTVEGEGGYTS